MPSDNSCLFTAFGGALPKQIPAQQLRRMMADYIKEHLDVYSEAVLGSSPDEYCRSIQDPDRWGGGIELSILSTIFDIQICTFDVQVRGPFRQSTVKTFTTDSHYRNKISLASAKKSKIGVS
jgi:ubiquitin thioesterase OTU1